MSKDIKIERFDCPHCGKSLTKKYLPKHIKNQHGDQSRKEKLIKTENNKLTKYKIIGGTYNSMVEVNDEELADIVDWDNVTDTELRAFEGHLEKLNINDNNNNNNKTKRKSNKKHVLEEDIQKKLEKKYGCGHQNTPAGIIDICTSYSIIEIKHWRGWHHAIGQLVVYSHYYPKHMKHIHFFGEYPSEDKLIIIKTICASLGIKISWEKN